MNIDIDQLAAALAHALARRGVVASEKVIRSAIAEAIAEDADAAAKSLASVSKLKVVNLLVDPANHVRLDI